MQKVRVMVACRRKVMRDGLALILNSAENLELIGRESANALREANKLQPDLLVYEINTTDDEEYEAIKMLKNLCNWTKIIIYSAFPLNDEALKRFLAICDVYLQGPILPGLLLKAVELACYSGYFFFLGSSKDIKPDFKVEVKQIMPVNMPGSN
ncbi:MAG: hypothetical protein VR69_02850 [Peptococcaceae bacterium BRH_c4b]|nr:MAG: hypothetical protein VR69_02850 [Peptococcaceae bacterium BRH_c4b]